MNSLHVAFDASLWDEPTTGIGLYTRELAAALQSAGTVLERVGARLSGEVPRGRMSRTTFALARLPDILSSSKAEVFHALANFNLPLVRPARQACVLTVHDVIPLTLPTTVSSAYRWQFRLWLARSLRVAHRVLCVSHMTKAALLARFPEAANKVRVVYSGVDHVSRVPPPNSTEQAYLEALALSRDFVLYAGSLDVRKNVAGVLDALEWLRARGRTVTLVLVGQDWFGSGPVGQRIGQMRAAGHDIRPLGYQPERILYALMRRAALFVFPSRDEGFGLPPLEAMRLGTPTIVSTAGALPEVCGRGARQVPLDNAEALATAMTELLDSPAARDALSDAGRAQVARFTWAGAAQEVLSVYAEALAARGSV